MPHEYTLREYALTPEPGDFIAVLVSRGTASLDDLIQAAADQDGSLTTEEVEKVVDAFRQAARTLLDQGFRVTGPLAVLFPTIQGIFEGQDDVFDPQRHRLQLSATPNQEFERAWQATAVLDKVEAR